MKKRGKINDIVKAFTTKSEISIEVRDKRREICNGCEWNSKNASSEKLNLLDKTRKKVSDKPFCIACDCVINKKTESETSECGLVEIGLEPKWNAVKIETVSSSDLNISNRSSDLCTISLEGEDSNAYYSLHLNKDYSRDYGNINLDLGLSADSDLKILAITKACNSCTDTTRSVVDKRNINAVITLLVDKISLGTFNKSVTVKYMINNKKYSTKITITGKVTR